MPRVMHVISYDLAYEYPDECREYDISPVNEWVYKNIVKNEWGLKPSQESNVKIHHIIIDENTGDTLDVAVEDVEI